MRGSRWNLTLFSQMSLYGFDCPLALSMAGGNMQLGVAPIRPNIAFASKIEDGSTRHRLKKWRA